MVDRFITMRGAIYAQTLGRIVDDNGEVPTFLYSEGRHFSWGRVDYLSRFFSPSTRSLGFLGSYPKCRAIPVTYDDAGVNFPGSGYVQVVAGMPLGRTNASGVTQFITAGVTTRSAVPSARHWLFPTIVIGGIPAGTTGTITISRAADWQTGADAATLYTIAVDGSKGMCQTFEIAEVISAPANLPPSVNIYVTASWVGTAPRTAFLSHSPANIHTGPIVPTTLHGDFTARQENDWQRTYDFGMQYRPFKMQGNFIPGNWSPHWMHFTRDYSSGTAAAQSLSSGTRPCRIALGMPDWMLESSSQGDASTPANEHLQKVIPRAWINNELKELAYWTRSRGLKAWVAFSLQLTVFSAGGLQATYDSGWTALNTGPGWRNVRAQCYNDTSDYPFITLDVLTVEIRMDGVSQGTMDFTAETMTGLPGIQKDIADIYPASRTMASLLEYRIILKGTAATSGSIRIPFYLTMSPRIDIPIPTHTVGADNLEAPGGYLAAGLADPTPIGGVLHCAAGVSSQAWSEVTGTTQWRLASFVAPTTGLYKVMVGAFNITLGRYEFGLSVQNSGLAQAGKRFFGGAMATDASLNGTYTLTAVTMTPKVIAAAGTTIANADLSPVTDGALFGTVAIPSAGRWRIWGRWRIVASAETNSIEMAVSLTDPYCIDSIDDRDTIVPWLPRDSVPTLVTATAPPGAPAHGTLRLVGTPATGVYAGHEGAIAYFDENLGWKLFDLGADDRTFATVDGVASFWDGEAWLDVSTMKNLECIVTTTGAQTVYLRANQSDPYLLAFRNAISPKANAATLTIGWEAA